MKREWFIFYQSFLEAWKNLPENYRLKFYERILKYGISWENEISEDGIIEAMFSLVKPQIDANNERFENGKKWAEYGKLWGRPPKPQNNPTETPPKPQNNPTETPPKPQNNPTETPKEKEKEKEKVKENAKDKENFNNNAIALLTDKSEAPVFWNKKINDMLSSLCVSVGCKTFKESTAIQRQIGDKVVKLYESVGKPEFMERLKGILGDPFKRKNSNSIKYLYGELKSYIHEGEWAPVKKKKIISDKIY